MATRTCRTCEADGETASRSEYSTVSKAQWGVVWQRFSLKQMHRHVLNSRLPSSAVNRKSAMNIKAKDHQGLKSPTSQTHVCLRVPCDRESRFFFQDTVVALQALSMFAARIGSHDTDVTIRVDIDPSTTVTSFQINNKNYLLHQSQQVHRWASVIGKQRLKYYPAIFVGMSQISAGYWRLSATDQSRVHGTVKQMITSSM